MIFAVDWLLKATPVKVEVCAPDLTKVAKPPPTLTKRCAWAVSAVKPPPAVTLKVPLLSIRPIGWPVTPNFRFVPV